VDHGEGLHPRPGVSDVEVSPPVLRKLCIFTGTTLGGYAGWALPDLFGWGFVWSFAISGVGSIVGVWAGWKLAMKLEE
jgi:hypothetical protein